MNLDLYTLTAFIVGILAGVCAGFWLAKFITGHTVERLERKIHSLSDNKFELKGSSVRLKQLEQRLDAEAARIPLAERELNNKSGEIRELTAALNETTALTSDLTAALRARKAKVQQLQLEQTKWLKRNKALLIKSETAEKTIAGLNKNIKELRKSSNAAAQNGTGQVKAGTPNGVSQDVPKRTSTAATNVTKAAPALAAGHHVTSGTQANGSVDKLATRMQQIESDLQGWFDRVGKLEANATGQMNQASGLALLEQVLRGEAETQDAAAKKAVGGQ